MRVLLLCVLLLLAGSPALAANWYVDDDAAGPGDGSFGDPFPTIQAGVDAATSAGDSVLILPGTYAENVAIGPGDNLIISGNSGDPADVIWTPTGTTVSSTGIALVNTANGTTVVVEDLTFQNGSGLTANQSGYTITADDATHTVRNVVFDGLNTCFWMYNTSGTTSTMTVDGCTFKNAQDTIATGSPSWAIQPRDAALTVTNSTFSQVGKVAGSWNAEAVIAWAEANDAGSTFTNCTFIGDQKGGEVWIYTRSAVSDIVIEGCSFTGGNGASPNDGLIKLGHTVTAGANAERVEIRNCTFTEYGHAAVKALVPAAATGAQYNRDIVIVDNTFIADGTNDDNTLKLTGIIGGFVGGNKFRGGATVAAVSLLSCRFVQVAGNDIWDADNGVVITANGSLDNSNQYGCSIVGNYFKGATDDGAIKIDNYDGTATAASPNDSLLTVAGNVFDGVTVVAKHVSTGDITSTFTTLAQYQAGWPAASSVDRGNTVGSSDVKRDWPFTGGGLNTIGVSGKGLIK